MNHYSAMALQVTTLQDEARDAKENVEQKYEYEANLTGALVQNDMAQLATRLHKANQHNKELRQVVGCTALLWSTLADSTLLTLPLCCSCLCSVTPHQASPRL